MSKQIQKQKELYNLMSEFLLKIYGEKKLKQIFKGESK